MFPARRLVFILTFFCLLIFTPLSLAVEETDPGGGGTPTPTPSPTQRLPEKPTSEKWTAADQATFTGNNLINMLSCLGSGLPFGAEGCPQTIFYQTGPKTMITYNGEGGGALGTSTMFIA